MCVPANNGQNHGQSLMSRLLARWASRTVYCDAYVYLLFSTISTCFTLFHGACSKQVWLSERNAYSVSISKYTVRPIRNTQQASE